MIKNRKIVVLALGASLLVGCSSTSESETNDLNGDTDEISQEIEAEELTQEDLVNRYIDFVVPNSQRMGDLNDEFVAHLTSDEEQGEEWLDEANIIADKVKSEAQLALDFNEIPIRYEEADVKYKDGMKSYIKSMNYFMESIGDNFNEDLMYKAAEEMENGNNFILESSSIISNLD